MITFVNTVLVGKGVSTVTESIETVDDLKDLEVGQYVLISDDKKFKVGMATSTKNAGIPVINWSNEIPFASIKHAGFRAHENDSQEKIEIDFSAITPAAVAEKSMVLRLTFKDLPTRYRKWTESYTIMTVAGDTAATIAQKFADKITSEFKRARVEASVAGNVLTLTAMPYDDDDTVDSISPANTVRFSANIWMTDPKAAGFASKNKYTVDGVKIKKTPGRIFAGSAKLVRDLEAQAMGYRGVLNRGECTWPIIKPAMNTDLEAEYNVITIEFEPAHHTADDLIRKTKQTLQIFDVTAGFNAIKGKLTSLLTGAGIELVDEAAEA